MWWHWELGCVRFSIWPHQIALPLGVAWHERAVTVVIFCLQVVIWFRPAYEWECEELDELPFEL